MSIILPLFSCPQQNTASIPGTLVRHTLHQQDWRYSTWCTCHHSFTAGLIYQIVSLFFINCSNLFPQYSLCFKQNTANVPETLVRHFASARLSDTQLGVPVTALLQAYWKNCESVLYIAIIDFHYPPFVFNRIQQGSQRHCSDTLCISLTERYSTWCTCHHSFAAGLLTRLWVCFLNCSNWFP